MREHRGGSQILFGFLPEQTVDLKGHVWKVREWQNPIQESVDSDNLRRELRRAASPWADTNRDGGMVRDLFQGRRVVVYSLNKANGVRVESFPNVWMCKACRRVRQSPSARCACGSGQFGQLPFVGYHDACGAIRSPFIPKCQAHNDVRIVLPGTASAAEIRFECPVCGQELRRGLGFPACQCGQGRLTFNVHRAASVYTPRTVVVVNPPSPERVRRLSDAGGARKALTWVINGMKEKGPEHAQVTGESLMRQLMEQGIAEAVAGAMVRHAVDSGQISPADDMVDLPSHVREPAEEQAVTLAMAVMESRRELSELAEGVAPASEAGVAYLQRYPRALGEAKLSSVELIDKFPVLTGNFGYTRGDAGPGAARLVPFRDRAGNYIVYGDIAQTEALMFRLNPVEVVSWLVARGLPVNRSSDDTQARHEILRAASVPLPGDLSGGNEVGRALLTLVHSYAHRVIRTMSVFAGVERHALAELLIPLHCTFLVYAAARGDFVLGGLQAVFENDLDRLLREITRGESRCPLDPGCVRGGGACMACLHIGEPSCRYFNRSLARAVLTGEGGFLSQRTRHEQSD